MSAGVGRGEQEPERQGVWIQLEILATRIECVDSSVKWVLQAQVERNERAGQLICTAVGVHSRCADVTFLVTPERCVMHAQSETRSAAGCVRPAHGPCHGSPCADRAPGAKSARHTRDTNKMPGQVLRAGRLHFQNMACAGSTREGEPEAKHSQVVVVGGSGTLPCQP